MPMTIRCPDSLAIDMTGESVCLRPLAQEMLVEVCRLEQACFAEPWSEKSLTLLLEENAIGITLWADGCLVAYGGLLTVLDEGQITNIAVSPDSRRRGFGKAVLTALTEAARERGLSVLSLEVRASNAAAIGLYETNGWVKAGERKNFYRFPTESAIVMLLDLKQ